MEPSKQGGGHGQGHQQELHSSASLVLSAKGRYYILVKSGLR